MTPASFNSHRLFRRNWSSPASCWAKGCPWKSEPTKTHGPIRRQFMEHLYAVAPKRFGKDGV